MTGGRVVILGKTGRNFPPRACRAVSLNVLDEAGDFASRVNMQMVELEKLSDTDEIEEIWKLIQRHQTYTRANARAKILADWEDMINRFVKVIPKD